MDPLEFINAAVKPLLGLKVMDASMGYAGSIFLEFGDLHKITKRTKRGKVYSYYKGDQTLSFFHYWEFERNGEIILKWDESTDDQIKAILPLINGSVLKSIKVEENSLDTTISFEGNKSFHIKNPSRKDSSDGALNVRFNRQFFSVGPGKELTWQWGARQDWE